MNLDNICNLILGFLVLIKKTFPVFYPAGIRRDRPDHV